MNNLGLRPGDIVLIHSDIANLGIPREFLSEHINPCEIVYSAIRAVIGDDGTIVVPTFSYSFCKGEDYDPYLTSSDVGVFGNYIRKLPLAKRNLDPIFSYAAIGPDSDVIADFSENNSFAIDSSPSINLYRKNAKVLFLGTTACCLTANHYIDNYFSVSFRFNKLFRGNIVFNNVIEKKSWIFHARVNVDETLGIPLSYHNDCLKRGILNCNHKINSYFGKLKDLMDFYMQKILSDEWCYRKGKFDCNLLVLDKNRTGCIDYNIDTKVQNDIYQLTNVLENIPRYSVCDGYDITIIFLSQLFNLYIYKFPSGTKSYEYIVPERWICYSAKIKNIKGDVIASSESSDLFPVPYSSSISQTMRYEELIKHLYLSDSQNEGYVLSNVRDWGLACNKVFYYSLDNKGHYQIEIQSDRSIGELKIAELTIKGDVPEYILFCTTLSTSLEKYKKGILGTISGLLLFNILKKRRTKFSYKLIIVPDEVGAACWLQHTPFNPHHYIGGIMIDIVDIFGAICFNRSLFFHSRLDELITNNIKLDDNYAINKTTLNMSTLSILRLFNKEAKIPMCSLIKTKIYNNDLSYAKDNNEYDSTVEKEEIDKFVHNISNLINRIELQT